MIRYHGLPIWPATAAIEAVGFGGHAFVSFHRPEQLGVAVESAASFAVDNGAFSAWRAGKPVEDWAEYYDWLGPISRIPSFDFAVIPDVIDGSEADNDALIAEWPLPKAAGVPVWHMHESLDRLGALAYSWPRVAIGSSGEFSRIGTLEWWARMRLAMLVACDHEGRPVCKLHGLRMLNPSITGRVPLASADSTNIARNIVIDSAWKGTYSPVNKAGRAAAMRRRADAQPAATHFDFNA